MVAYPDDSECFRASHCIRASRNPGKVSKAPIDPHQSAKKN